MFGKLKKILNRIFSKSFIEGFLSGINLGNIAPPPHPQQAKHKKRLLKIMEELKNDPYGWERDKKAMESDWRTTGDDLRRAMKKADETLKEKK